MITTLPRISGRYPRQEVVLRWSSPVVWEHEVYLLCACVCVRV